MNNTPFCKQSEEWECIFYKVIAKALNCPILALLEHSSINIRALFDAAGNHIFDDHHDFWGITEQEGTKLRSFFQSYDSNNPIVVEYSKEGLEKAN